jgi:hypothetical protein
MHQQGERDVPKSVVFLKDIQRKEADESSEEEAKNPGSPEQAAFHGSFHNGNTMVASHVIC